MTVQIKEPPAISRATSTGMQSGLSSLKGRHFKSEMHLVHLGEEPDSRRQGELSQRIEDLIVQADEAGYAETPSNLVADVLDISATLNDAAAAVVDDSFLRCFKSAVDEPWNWNFYLLPLWCLGVVVRNFILFPIRVLTLLSAFLLFFIGFAVVGVMLRGQRRKRAERALVHFLAQAFCVSWTGVIRYHGPRPVPSPGRVWVSNHTSMIDYAVLCAYSPFAAIMQLHPGWVGMMQKRYLSALGCLWFNRTQVSDRSLVTQRMRDHVWVPDATPLLIFPEGTCVNNEHCVMFKRGAFDLGATVCPVAIKYNKIFVDAFWNSKRQSFSAHLAKIMRSWALVADVWFLQPQTRAPGESASDFAQRVQKLIADKARLKVAPWDGYLKYYNLGEKHPDLIERQRKVYAQRLQRWQVAAEQAAADRSGEPS